VTTPAGGFKVVAFDLDGTLADTASLSDGRRPPSMVLQHCKAGQRPTALEFSQKVSRLPSRVMRRGALTAVVTRSPFPYASTLCYLLGIDFNTLLTSRDGGSVESRLAKLIEGARIEPGELLYVGDRDADKTAADAVGAAFLWPPWLRGDPNDTGRIESSAARISLLYDVDHPVYRRGNLLMALRLAAKTGASLPDRAVDALADADLDEELRSSLAWLLLRTAPSQNRRDQLQTVAFAAVPDSAYDCVIPRRVDYGMTCVSRTVICRAEYENMTTKRDRYFELLRHLHPPTQITTSQMTSDHPHVPVWSFRRFHDPRGGELLRIAKDWRGAGKGQAGPEVVLSLIELPTVVIAAHLAADTSASRVPVVAVPASPWTTSKPGQVSQRIAIDAAALSGREPLDVLTKTANGIACNTGGHGRTVTVIDDQLTQGGSASAAVTALRRAGFHVQSVVTWSASDRHWTARLEVAQKCWLTDARWLLGRGGACPDELDTDSDDALEAERYLDSIKI
jgi:hypothetical protein